MALGIWDVNALAIEANEDAEFYWWKYQCNISPIMAEAIKLEKSKSVCN
jgi:hypothetical protein